METLIKKIKSDSSYLWLKTMESEIYISGFPKKACQGCHISELAQWNDARCTSFWSILDPWLNGIVGIHWSWNDPRKQLCRIGSRRNTRIAIGNFEFAYKPISSLPVRPIDVSEVVSCVRSIFGMSKWVWVVLGYSPEMDVRSYRKVVIDR